MLNIIDQGDGFGAVRLLLRFGFNIPAAYGPLLGSVAFLSQRLGRKTVSGMLTA